MFKYVIHFIFLIILIFILMGCSENEDNPLTVKDDYYTPVIEPSNFAATVSNPYYPLEPGNIWKYAGSEDGVVETNDVEVLTDTKIIMGVTCTVVLDQVYEDASLVEETYDWYAEDKSGNVWYMGEDSKEIEDGEVVSTEGSWEAGVDGAQPGIIMWSDPYPGIPYRQEYYYSEAEDWAQVVSILESMQIGIGTYYDVVKIREWTPLEPDIEEYKYFAPNVGLIKEEVSKGGSGSMELTEFQN